MSKKYTIKKIGRDAETGRFIPVKKAQQNPKTTEVETIKIPVKSKF